jgi:subtilisin family serine protease
VVKRALRLLVVLALVAPAVAGLASSAYASNDTYTARQWALKKVGAEKAWASGRGKGVVVAVIDSGVDLHHEDLKGAFVKGRDFVDDDNDASDGFGHGTHVAGIAAARANNDIGIAGVAPDAKIMPLRVLDTSGNGTNADVDAAIHWAVDHGADVLNLSLSDGVTILDLFGGPLTSALNYAFSKGVVPVIVTGNDGAFRTELKSANALFVTATGPDDRIAPYANAVGFAKWGLAAPGGTDADGKASMVYSTIWDKKGRTHYGWGMGTSMAAPHVAGAAAVLRGMGLSAQQTVDRLMSTAKDLGNPGYDRTYGAGRLDVAAAVRGLKRSSAAAASLEPSADPSVSAPTATAAGATGDATSGTEPTAAPSADAIPRPTVGVDGPGSPGTRSPQEASRLGAIAGDDARRTSPLPALALACALAAFGCALVGYAGRRGPRRT